MFAERLGGKERLARRHHQAAAVEQRPPDFQRRGVEREVRVEGESVRRRERQVIRRAHQPRDRAVRDDDAFRGAGRARGVQDIRRRLAGERTRLRHGWQLRRATIGELTVAGRSMMAWQSARRICLPRGRLLLIERQISAAGFQDAKNGRDEDRRARRRQPDPRARREVELVEQAGDSVRPGVELGVSAALVVLDHRHGGRILFHPFRGRAAAVSCPRETACAIRAASSPTASLRAGVLCVVQVRH